MVAVVERHVHGLLARTGAVRWLGECLVPAVIADPLPRELLRRLPAAYHPRAIDASMRELRGTSPSPSTSPRSRLSAAGHPGR